MSAVNLLQCSSSADPLPQIHILDPVGFNVNVIWLFEHTKRDQFSSKTGLGPLLEFLNDVHEACNNLTESRKAISHVVYFGGQGSKCTP